MNKGVKRQHCPDCRHNVNEQLNPRDVQLEKERILGRKWRDHNGVNQPLDKWLEDETEEKV